MKKQHNEQQQLRKLFVFLSALSIWITLVTLWSYTWMQFYAEIIARPFGYKGNWLVFALYGVVLFLLTHIYSGYKVGYHRRGDIIFSGALALLFANFISYIQTCLLGAKMLSPWPVITITGIGVLLIGFWAFITQWIYQKIYPPYQLLMIYDGKLAAQALVKKIIRRDDKYRICETIHISENIDYIHSRMKAYSSVLLCDISSKQRNQLLKYAYQYRISIYMTPKLSDILIRSAEQIELFDSPILLSQNHDLSLEQKFIKRAMDIVIASAAFVLTLPIMLLISVAIKIDDHGPVFFTQQRLTLGGKIFKMYKFRTMIVDADKVEVPRLASENDPRITRVGNFLRKIRLDELPQIFNILKGEMSVVGPRPEHPEIAKIYLKSIPEFCFRLNVKAGLTGYAQVIGKYNTTPYDKIKMDLMYITGYSVLLDIKILFMTFKILFNFESTEGVSQEETTAEIYNKKEE